MAGGHRFFHSARRSRAEIAGACRHKKTRLPEKIIDTVRKLRVYPDTSVFGGCFDLEFDAVSKQFFAEVVSGRFIVVVSGTTLDELARAPEPVRRILATLPVECVEVAENSPDVAMLQQAYLAAGVVGKASSNDAAHIAAATVANVDMVVSWNFKHIVHFD
jgi:hypothetical protein